MQSRLTSNLPIAGWLCILPMSFAAPPLLTVTNGPGVRMSVDAEDSNPALMVIVPGGPESERKALILLPEHVTVRAHGQTEQRHLYVFKPGQHADPPKWSMSGNALAYETDFGAIHFAARATLVADGIIFRYDFDNRSDVDYDVATAVTDPRFHAIFYDPRLQRTWVHHSNGFDLLASETPARLTMPLKDWFPARYHASYTVPVPQERVQHRADGITYYYKSKAVDVPLIATVSEDGKWVAASVARNSGNVWSNPELTCQHVDPEIPLPRRAHGAYEIKIYIFQGSINDALQKARERQFLK